MKINLAIGIVFLLAGCGQTSKDQSGASPIRLITVDPGHFHAALVQKNTYPEVDSEVHVYAPEGNDIKLHLNRIEGFNSRDMNPTDWSSIIYTGADFWNKMLEEKPGNVIVLAGNNQRKTEYISQSIQSGLNVLADKPMAIDLEGYQLLKSAFSEADKGDLILYDIMTERYEITSILQKELTLIPEIFGTFQKGSIDQPTITKESVHHFNKYVAGSVLVRPPWFFDVNQEGNGLVDVTTHLVDLIQWQSFPGQSLDTTDVQIDSSRLWPTRLSEGQFKEVTQTEGFPEFLSQDIVDDTLLVNCNGQIDYQLKDIHARVSVIWNYKAPEGGADTHFSMIRGTKANLIIRQGKEENFQPELFIKPISDKLSEATLMAAFEPLKNQYPGIELESSPIGWHVIIPDTYRNGHEAHFGQVMEKYIGFLTSEKMPEWEVPNMITKYYTTTKAAEMAKN